ncbi:glycoside hydrolase superfamily [Phlyctochytrium arcticum]|nr:glycoside hydrolase superfamily [Phlyctochytrium arcticum]
MKLSSAACLLVAAASTFVAAQAPLEPPKIIFGAWLDTAPNKDTPKAFGDRLGRAPSVIHMAENLPLESPHLPPTALLDEAKTNAFLYLSVYPTILPDQVTDAVINPLVAQIATFVNRGRGVFLRLAPEMNGSWQPYAQRPLAYIAMWKRLVTAIRARPDVRDRVAFIWAPNMQAGYPYGNGQYSMTPALDAAEFAALDTNKNGQLDEMDDPYLPYYPGNDVIDWVGLSTYYFGADFPYLTNVLPPAGRYNQLLHGFGPNAQNFYQLFAENNKKPLFITEAGAAFHQYRVPSPTSSENAGAIDPGPGALAIKQAWWRQYITNTTFLDQHPRLKAICVFEWEKPEESTFRDFSITKDPTILAAFKQDFEPASSRYLFATPANIVTDPEARSSSGGILSAGKVTALFAGMAGAALAFVGL